MPKVDAKQLEPCPGPERSKQCLRGERALADPAIAGFDKVFRCVECHRVHAELVFNEAGNANPNPGDHSNARPVALPQGVDAARRAAMLARAAPRGGYTTPPRTIRPAEASEPLPPELRPERESEVSRRARILKKYGK